jgi:cytidine deaminase
MDESRLAALVSAAREARASAYAPYSGFAVGAAIGVGDRSFVGVNVENTSFPVSQCAERNAVAAMILAGGRDPDAIAIVTDADVPTPPCGACRQALAEFAGPATAVVAETVAGRRAEWTLGELFPVPFAREAP